MRFARAENGSKIFRAEVSYIRKSDLAIGKMEVLIMAIVRVMGEKMYSIGLGLIGSGSVLSRVSLVYSKDYTS